MRTNKVLAATTALASAALAFAFVAGPAGAATALTAKASASGEIGRASCRGRV